MPDYSINILWEPVEIPGVQIPCCRVDGWRECYAVSCKGDIWSSYRPGRNKPENQWGGPWRAVTPQINPGGYSRFILTKGSRKSQEFVHSLVLEAFKEAWPGGRMECRHLDGDPGNNWWWNLQWGTRQENSDDKFDHGTVLQCEDHPKVVITAVMVAEARRAYAGGENLYSIARRLGAKPNTIGSAICGRSWKELTDPPPVPARPNGKAITSQIRALILQGLPAGEIASLCGVSMDAVYRQRWKMKKIGARK